MSWKKSRIDAVVSSQNPTPTLPEVEGGRMVEWTPSSVRKTLIRNAERSDCIPTQSGGNENKGK